eukprot:scaffold16609_cov17-Tisochrysis_lutea.AAC.2
MVGIRNISKPPPASGPDPEMGMLLAFGGYNGVCSFSTVCVRACACVCGIISATSPALVLSHVIRLGKRMEEGFTIEQAVMLYLACRVEGPLAAFNRQSNWHRRQDSQSACDPNKGFPHVHCAQASKYQDVINVLRVPQSLPSTPSSVAARAGKYQNAINVLRVPQDLPSTPSSVAPGAKATSSTPSKAPGAPAATDAKGAAQASNGMASPAGAQCEREAVEKQCQWKL